MLMLYKKCINISLTQISFVYILKISENKCSKHKNHSIKLRNGNCVELPNNKYKEKERKIFQNLFTF